MVVASLKATSALLFKSALEYIRLSLDPEGIFDRGCQLIRSCILGTLTLARGLLEQVQAALFVSKSSAAKAFKNVKHLRVNFNHFFSFFRYLSCCLGIWDNLGEKAWHNRVDNLNNEY